MSIDWDTSGFEAFLDSIAADVDAAVPFAVGRAAEHIRAVSVALAPIRDGDLRDAAGVEATGHNSARVVYQSVYARYQHYGLDFRHPQGGQALYLQQPMLTEAEKCFQIMADTIREAMG